MGSEQREDHTTALRITVVVIGGLGGELGLSMLSILDIQERCLVLVPYPMWVRNTTGS